VTDVRQFGDLGTRSLDCVRCEAMLADAVDGMLSQEEQGFFQSHVGECGPCAQLLAEGRRGAAWLEMLRTPAPQPSSALLEKILAQTSGAIHPIPIGNPAPAMAPGYSNVLPFPRRAAAALRATGFGRVAFEPRIAMTAAMAFFSIALTMDLMGVNPLDVRAGDLSPSGLHRSFAEMNARVVQYYEGLRVVYELESRVHDFENVQQDARDAAQPAEGQQAQPSGGSQQPQSAPEQENDGTPQATPQAAPAGQEQPGGKSSLEPAAPRAVPANDLSRREGGKGGSGSIAVFPENARKNRAGVSDAALDKEIQEYFGGVSTAVYTGPLPEHKDHERRGRQERKAA
jgi:hypothetical protein